MEKRRTFCLLFYPSGWPVYTYVNIERDCHNEHGAGDFHAYGGCGSIATTSRFSTISTRTSRQSISPASPCDICLLPFVSSLNTHTQTYPHTHACSRRMPSPNHSGSNQDKSTARGNSLVGAEVQRIVQEKKEEAGKPKELKTADYHNSAILAAPKGSGRRNCRTGSVVGSGVTASSTVQVGPGQQTTPKQGRVVFRVKGALG